MADADDQLDTQGHGGVWAWAPAMEDDLVQDPDAAVGSMLCGPGLLLPVRVLKMPRVWTMTCDSVSKGCVSTGTIPS